MPVRDRRRRVAWSIGAAAAAAALVVALLLAAHAAPVRREVLRRAALVLAERYNLALRADTLSYNLLSRRVVVSGVSLAAVGTPEQPFLTAAVIEARFPVSAFFGALAIDSLRVDEARVDLRWQADGTSNLPTTGATGDSEAPAALVIDRLDVPRLAIDVVHAGAGVALSFPKMSVDLRSGAGRLHLAERGRIARGDRSAAVTAFGGGVAFDGRRLSLDRFAAALDDAELTADGTVALLVAEPGLDLRLRGSASVSGLARWTTSAPVPEGRVSVDATVTGPIGLPTVAAQLRSASLSYRGATLASLEAEVSVDGSRLDARRIQASMADGRLSGAARLTFDSGFAEASATWSDLNVDALRRMVDSRGGFTAAGHASGSAAFSGIWFDAARWNLSLDNRVVAGRVAPGRLPMSGRAALAIADGRWRLDGNHRIEGASLRAALSGAIDLETPADSSLSGTVFVNSESVPRLLASLDAAGLLEASTLAVDGGRLDARAAVSGTVRRPAARLGVTGQGFAVAGLLGLDLEATAAGTLERAAVEARVQQGTANGVTLTGTVWPEQARMDVRLAGTLHDAASLAPAVPLSGTADLRLDARGRFDAPTVAGAVSVRDARYGGAALGTLDARLAFDGGVARVEMAATDFGAEARAEVRLGGDRAGVIDAQIRNAAIDRLLKVADIDAALTGTLSLTAHAEGSLSDWRRAVATIDVTALDARADALPVRLQAPARVRYESGTLDVAGLEAALGETRLSVGGRYALLDGQPAIAPGEALRAVLVGDVAQVLEAARAAGLAGTLDVAGTGPLVVLARTNGHGARPLVSADVELGPAELAVNDLPPVREVRMRARLIDGWAQLLPSSARWQEALIALEGRVPVRLAGDRLPPGLLQPAETAADPATLDLRAQSVSALALAPWLPAESLSQIEGDLDASLHLESTSLDWEGLSGEARLDRLDVAVAGLAVAQQTPTRIRIERGIAQVADWTWTGRGARLVVQGEVRLPDRRVGLLAGGEIDLRMLTPFLPAAELAVSGRVAPRVSIAGALDRPFVEGDLTLTEGELRLRRPAVVAAGVTATATLAPDRVRVTQLDGQINGGALTGTGEIAYGTDTGVAGRLAATIMAMGLEYEGLRSEINADLGLELSQPGGDLAGALNGTVTVVRSAYREPIAVVTQLLAVLRADRLAAAALPEPGFADRLQLNVRVLTDSDVVVDNNLARLQLGGDLRVIGTAAAPGLSGRATLREGGELFIGRNRYTIESGTIDFANPNAIEPTLDVQSHTRAAGTDIELTLEGTPETLSVDLRSPSHPELGQADLASLLLTGRALSEVSGAEAQIVGEQVLGYLSGDVLGAASRVVGLDTLRLGGVDSTLRRDSAEIASETDPTSRLTFGKSLGPLVDLTLSQSLRDSAQTWILDYTPFPRVDLRLVSDDDNLRSYQFRHDVTFGSAAARARPIAQGPRERARVAAVSFEGELGGPEERLRRVIALEPGDAFDFSEWQGDRDRLERALHAEGRFEARVSTRRLDDADAVALTYRIDAGPPTAIRFEGHTPSAGTLRAVEAAWARAVFDEALIDEVTSLVVQALIEDGHSSPAVAARMADDGVKTLTVAVEPGVRSAGRRVVIDADDEAVERDLAAWLRTSGREAQVWRDPAAFERALRDELRTRGRLDPRVTVEPIRAEGQDAVVPVTVRAGPLVTVRDVRFDPAGLDLDAVRTVVTAEAGAPYDPSAVEQARERLVRALRADGFADARVEVRVAPEPDGRQVAVVFAVEPGPRQVLHEIRVTGNRSIDRDVIVRTLDVDAGDPIGADAWLRLRSRLFDTALFRRVDVAVEPLADASGGERPVRLAVTVEEWPALRLRYGFQLSEERPEQDPEGRDLTPGLSADVTRRTLFGHAITVGGAVEYQRRQQLARGFLNAPTLFGVPLESLLSVERVREEIADANVVSARSGVAWEQRVQVAAPVRLAYGYQFDRDHTFSTRPSNDPLNPPFDVTVSVARLTGSMIFDSRNDPLEASRGWLLSSNLEYAPSSLGSDIRFWRYLAQAYRFQPLGPVVVASAARLGLAAALGGQSLIPSERFYAGGARTVRGVPENALGPRDIFDDAAGGGALLVLNQEVRFPIYRWFRGVGFVDAGNVFERPGSIHPRKLVGSVGAGLRLTTPFALLRADVAQLWSPEADRPVARWTFGIGHAF